VWTLQLRRAIRAARGLERNGGQAELALFGSQRGGKLWALHAIDLPDQKKHHKRHDDKVDHGIDVESPFQYEPAAELMLAQNPAQSLRQVAQVRGRSTAQQAINLTGKGRWEFLFEKADDGFDGCFGLVLGNAGSLCDKLD
jgi:hypothetical protein